MEKAIYHMNPKAIADYITGRHPGIMKLVDLLKITQDWEDPSSLILDFQYREEQSDGMQYITAIMVLDPEQNWTPADLPLFEQMTAPSN